MFAGDAAVGKTSFINRITKGYFMENLSSTLGVDFQVKTFLVDDRNIALQLWDTAGQVNVQNDKQTKFKFIHSNDFFYISFIEISPKLFNDNIFVQERFRAVTKSYFRRADGVMLLYDVTNERSFVAVRDWIEAVDVSYNTITNILV